MCTTQTVGRQTTHAATCQCSVVTIPYLAVANGGDLGWNRSLPEKPAASVLNMYTPKGLDGLALFEVCQTHPQLKELKLSASSFDSPVQGQWELRALEKLRIELSDLSGDHHAADNIFQHADKLYLKELHLINTGPGFAVLHARSLANLHIENLSISGFDIRGAADLVGRQGQLTDCVVDVSQTDISAFYRHNISFVRCRLPSWSWRLWSSVVCAAAFFAGLLAIIVVYPQIANYVWFFFISIYIVSVGWSLIS